MWSIIFWPEISNLLEVYSHSGYDYQGFFIPPLILFMSQYKNAALKRSMPTYSRYGLLCLLLIVLTWQFAEITQIHLLKYIAMFGMIPAIVWITCGKKVVGILRFQLCLLVLLLPVGQEFFIYLQNTFAGLTVNILSILGQPVYWDGNNIYLGTKHYVISSFFISLQYFMIYLTAGAVYAFFTGRGLIQRLAVTANFVLIPFLLLLIAFLIMILLVNSIRPADLVLASWCLTATGIISAIIFGWRIASRNRLHTVATDIDWQSSYPNRKSNLLVPVIMATCFLSTTVIIKQFNFEPKYYNSTLHVPANLAAWGQPITFATNNGQSFLAEYKKNKQNIFFACSNAQTPNQLLDVNRTEWQPIKNRKFTVTLANHKLQVIETILRNQGISRIIWTFYNTNGHLTADQQHRHLLERLYGLSPRGIVSTVSAIATHVDTDLGAGRDTLTEFLQSLQDSGVLHV